MTPDNNSRYHSGIDTPDAVWKGNLYYPLHGPPVDDEERKILTDFIAKEQDALHAELNAHQTALGRHMEAAANQNCADKHWEWRRCLRSSGSSYTDSQGITHSGNDIFCSKLKHSYTSCMDHNRTFLLRLGFVSAVKRSSFTDINKDGDVLKIMDQADEMYLKLSSPSSTNN